jgi:hypothetical protein
VILYQLQERDRVPHRNLFNSFRFGLSKPSESDSRTRGIYFHMLSKMIDIHVLSLQQTPLRMLFLVNLCGIRPHPTAAIIERLTWFMRVTSAQVIPAISDLPSSTDQLEIEVEEDNTIKPQNRSALTITDLLNPIQPTSPFQP